MFWKTLGIISHLWWNVTTDIFVRHLKAKANVMPKAAATLKPKIGSLGIPVISPRILGYQRA
jgi:hypothetical protein